MTLYSIQSTANRFIDSKYPESLQKDPESLHHFEQLNSLGALSTDNNNNKIGLILLLYYILVKCTIHGNKI